MTWPVLVALTLRLSHLALLAVFGLGARPDSIPLPEHPRPDFQRDLWLNLNGRWRFAFDPADSGERAGWAALALAFIQDNQAVSAHTLQQTIQLVANARFSAAEIDHELASVKTLGGFAPAFLEFVDPWLNQLPFYDQPPFSPGIES